MPAKKTPRKRKISKYVIEKQIGKGSAANIYLAKQDVLGRKLVIKELLPHFATNEKIISRFRREAKVVSQLTHDAIVHVYDYWVRTRSYYIAMEYVQGQTLRQILATVPFVPVHIAAIILYHVCRGLEHAHSFGVVHRDLKPANIIISNTGQVKILDFGIAHFQYDDNLTSLGTVIGTYNYMSPEQALGKKVTPASDIFSLGILFYEMLTGYKPFAKDEKEEVLEKIIHRGVHPPGKRNPAVPRRFGRIIRRCLRKRATRRFQDTGEIKKRLERYLRRYPLDHQYVLKTYLDNLTPKTVDRNWPPNFWGRIWYRMGHLRIRTYVYLVLGVLTIAGLEYRLISRGVGVGEQWDSVKSAVESFWHRWISGRESSEISPQSTSNSNKDTQGATQPGNSGLKQK